MRVRHSHQNWFITPSEEFSEVDATFAPILWMMKLWLVEIERLGQVS